MAKFFNQFFVSRFEWLALLLVIIILVGGGYFILFPKFQELRPGGRYHLDSYLLLKESRANHLQDLKALVNNYKSISQNDIDKLRKVLPPQQDIAGLFVQLDYIAKKNGFFLQTIDIREEKVDPQREREESPAIKKLEISINLVGGNYFTLKNFLNDIETNLRLFDVKGIHFSKSLDSFIINLSTYYQ